MKIVNHFEEKLKERNIKGSVQFEVGKPGEIVLAYADRYRGTHIVMGTRGFGLLRRTILGSTSEYVIHHAKIPVTVVPPETKSWFFWDLVTNVSISSGWGGMMRLLFINWIGY